MKYRNALVLFVFTFIIISCVYAQKIKRYADFPKHAAEPSAFLNMRKSDSVDLDFTFKFEKQSNLPLMHKASRILAKKIVEKTVATPTISAAELWERRLKNLKNLDDEAEEYLEIPVLSSDSVEISSKEDIRKGTEQNGEAENTESKESIKSNEQAEECELSSDSYNLKISENESEEENNDKK